MSLPSGSRMTDYLLGRLAPADRESVREEVLASEEAWNEIVAAEEELIDGYVRNELDADLRVLVEQRLLCSEAGRRKLKMARALLQADSAPQRGRIWAIGLAAVAVVLLVAGLSIWRGMRVPEVTPALPPVSATLIIPLSVERGQSAVREIKLPPGVARLHIELRLASPETSPGGTARFLFRDVERSYPVSIQGALAVLDLDRGELHEGPCEIELSASGKLVAAGSVVFRQP